MRAMYGVAHVSGIPGCSARSTYERVVKPFGSTVKKVVRIEVESWENVGYEVAVGEFENEGQKTLGPQERGQKIFEYWKFGKKDRTVWYELPLYRLVYSVAQCW